MTVLLGHGHVFSPANKTTMLKKYLSAFSLTALLALSLTGCDEGTGIIGSEIMPPHDEITTADSVFRINTQIYHVEELTSSIELSSRFSHFQLSE